MPYATSKKRRGKRLTLTQRRLQADLFLSHETMWRIMNLCAVPKVAKAINAARRLHAR